MKIFAVIFLVLSFVVSAAANDDLNKSGALASFSSLEKAAREKTAAKPRLAVSSAEMVKNIKNADALESGNAPNYILALAAQTKAAPQMANLVQTFLFGGTVAPETKMAMGLKIAQIYNSPYLFAHASRWLRASAAGQNLLKDLENNKTAGLSESENLALRYADLLTRDVHGVTDADFAKTRAAYNDSQMVELTMTVCFFNHFVRTVEALNLPVEEWVLNDKSPKTPANLAQLNQPSARIALISDDEITATTTAVNAAKEAQKPAAGLGLGLANSQRAMMRVPAFANTWRDFGFANRSNWTIDRNIQLQVSFAVSNANQCRYCTLHQVLGLRRLGVDVKKLVAMQKDDSALTGRELAAVEFARKLTKDPKSVTDADFAKLKTEFGEQGAMEVVLQTGAFAFMNRFTDNLGLPSEDEAVRTYQETYGENAYRDFKK